MNLKFGKKWEDMYHVPASMMFQQNASMILLRTDRRPLHRAQSRNKISGSSGQNYVGVRDRWYTPRGRELYIPTRSYIHTSHDVRNTNSVEPLHTVSHPPPKHSIPGIFTVDLFREIPTVAADGLHDHDKISVTRVVVMIECAYETSNSS